MKFKYKSLGKLIKEGALTKFDNIKSVSKKITTFRNVIMSKDYFGDIYFLTEHIKSQFEDLQAYSLFDINWLTVNTLQKFSKISARIELRDIVNKDDLIKVIKERNSL